MFRPLVIFGLGGAAAEVFADHVARLTPLTDTDADKLIRSIRSAPLLLGHGGRPAADLGALRDLLLRVSRRADDLPEVTDLDLNPVIAARTGHSRCTRGSRSRPPSRTTRSCASCADASREPRPGRRVVPWSGYRLALSTVYSTLSSRGVYPVHVVATQTDASRARYQSRPGRRAIVAASLADLRGPKQGTVELPLWLFWSSPGHTFDLGDRDMRQWLYQTVLREAGRQEDLTTYLDGDTLIALWPDLYLPQGVRQAWEDQHPVLRAAAAA
jgi:hypothetical protein